MGGCAGVHVQQPIGAEGRGLALDGKRFEWLDLDGVPREPIRLLDDENLAWRGAPLQTRGHVYRVSGDEPVAARRIAGDHLTAGNAHPRLEPHAVLVLELVVQLGQAVAHLRRRPNGSQRVVFVQMRDPEHSHDGIADELLDRAAMALQGHTHLVEVPADRAPQRLGIKPLAERRRAGEVGEDDGHCLPELPRRSRGQECRSTLTAELEAVRAQLSALRTCLHGLSVGPEDPQFLGRREMPKVGIEPTRSSRSTGF